MNKKLLNEEKLNEEQLNKVTGGIFFNNLMEGSIFTRVNPEDQNFLQFLPSSKKEKGIPANGSRINY